MAYKLDTVLGASEGTRPCGSLTANSPGSLPLLRTVGLPDGLRLMTTSIPDITL